MSYTVETWYSLFKFFHLRIMPKIEITWSKLLSFKKEEIEKLEEFSGVYRLSKKKEDGKYYVFYVGSAENIKEKLLSHLSEDSDRVKQFSTLGDCSFRYAPIAEKNIRESIERQLYRHYLPELNPKEPESFLDIEANLN